MNTGSYIGKWGRRFGEQKSHGSSHDILTAASKINKNPSAYSVAGIVAELATRFDYNPRAGSSVQLGLPGGWPCNVANNNELFGSRSMHYYATYVLCTMCNEQFSPVA